MNDLFANLQTSTIATLLVVSMVPTYLLMLVQAVYNVPLRNNHARLGIASLQFARTTKRSQEIVNSWGDKVRTVAIPGLWLDYLFLISYAITMVLGCVWSGPAAWRPGRVADEVRRNLAMADGLGRILRRDRKPGTSDPALLAAQTTVALGCISLRVGQVSPDRRGSDVLAGGCCDLGSRPPH